MHALHQKYVDELKLVKKSIIKLDRKVAVKTMEIDALLGDDPNGDY